MKKIYFCVLFTLTMMCADAQHDTLKIGALVISKAATTETSSWKERDQHVSIPSAYVS